MHIPKLYLTGTLPLPPAAFTCHLKAKVGSTLAKAAALRENLNLDGAPLALSIHNKQSNHKASPRFRIRKTKTFPFLHWIPAEASLKVSMNVPPRLSSFRLEAKAPTESLAFFSRPGPVPIFFFVRQVAGLVPFVDRENWDSIKSRQRCSSRLWLCFV